jgi:hypothetical protein
MQWKKLAGWERFLALNTPLFQRSHTEKTKGETRGITSVSSYLAPPKAFRNPIPPVQAIQAVYFDLS